MKLKIITGLMAAIILVSGYAFDKTEKITTLQCGDYQLKISAKYKYTVRKISYQGTALGTQNGFYGTVMAIASGKYIGAGHDQGGEEQLLNVELFANGAKTDLKLGKITAKRFLLRKVSMMDKLKFLTEITLTPEGMIESKRFIATAEQPMHLMFIYLLCLNKTMTDWQAETITDEKITGKFDGDFEGKSRWLLQKDVKWAAEYDAKSQHGVLLYYPQPIAGMGRRSAFWEVKNAYNKYYLMLKTPKSYSAGYKSPTYTMILKGFSCEAGNLDKSITETVTAAAKIESPKLANDQLTTAKQPEKILDKTKQQAKPTVASGSIQAAVSFNVDYTNRAESINAQQADGDKTGKLFFTVKPKFEFDLMAHTVRGLIVGKNGSSVQYQSKNNLTLGRGTIELVVKNIDWEWRDKERHVFMQSSYVKGNNIGKFFIYKYRTSGIAAYIELNKSGKKVFLNYHPPKSWKLKSWHHIAVTYSPEEIILYVDGIKRKSGQLPTIKRWCKGFYVGPSSKKFGYNGQTAVNSVTLYKRALTAEEIKTLAKERLPDLKINISAAEKKMLGPKIIGKASPWFKHRPKLGMQALAADTVLPPWTPITYATQQVGVWGRKYNLTGNRGIFSAIVSQNKPLLNAPIEIFLKSGDQASQTVTFTKPATVVEQAKGRITLSRTAKLNNGIEINLKYLIEYDGMAWCQLKIIPNGKPINRLSIVVPLDANIAKFIHYVGAPNRYESQDLPKNSFSRALPEDKKLLYASDFKTNVWLGNNQCGLLWFAESDQYWWPKKRGDEIAVVRTSPQKVQLLLQMVTKQLPYGKCKELVYQFGFMATPVKTLPKHWRGMTFSAQYDSFSGIKRGTNLIYWPNEWRFMSLDPDPTRALNITQTKNKIIKDRTAGRKIIPYWTRLHFPTQVDNKINPDAQLVKNEWATIPNRPGGGSHQMYRASCNSSWQDYLVWCVEEWTKIMGHTDGVYIDETQPIPNSNSKSGGGYTDLDGIRRPTFEFFGSRNLIKRITYNTWKRNNGELPYSIAHCSATYMMQALSMYTSMLVGEHIYSGYFANNPEFLPPAGDQTEKLYYYSYALPMDRLRAECYWKQWGAVMIWLPCLKNQRDIWTNPITTRDMLSRIMQADMLVWPLFCNSDEVYKTWKFRKAFGIADEQVTFTPYWENKTITTNVKDVVVGYYQNAYKYLLIVSNLNRSNKTVKITFRGIDLNLIKNAETNQPIAVNDKSIKLDILRNDYIALEVN